MKYNKRLTTGVICLAALIILGMFWWSLPSHIINIAPSEVSKIEIFDGNTGKAITLTNAADIEHIIINLNAIAIKKDKVSLGYMGTSFRTTIYKAGGGVYKKFIINSSTIIRKDPFFYRASSGNIDYDYIKGLIDAQVIN